jgi:hypothetical protein
MTPEHIRLRPDALEWRELDGEIVALDLRTSTYLAVNRTGATVWPMVVAGATEAELTARIAREFGVSREIAAEGLRSFVHELDERDLLDR